MRVLVVGSGGREHALTWACARSGRADALFAAPGNAGMAELATTVGVAATDAGGLAEAVRQHRIDLVVVGPDAALAAGVADACAAAGALVFGPTKAAARIESSKVFAKQLMDDAGIATARWAAGSSADREALLAFARARGGKVAVKADGLALGKGVTICDSVAAAQEALTSCFDERKHGAAGDVVLVEELLAGGEVSVFAICDGSHAFLLPPARDYKRAFDGDLGPNTGGMGAYSPLPDVDNDALLTSVAAGIVTPCLTALRDRGAPFRGCLYAGLMLTAEGPRVLEFNARFGDPETQALMPLLDAARFFELMTAAARGELPGDGRLTAAAAGVTVVAAGHGYPASSANGLAIELPSERPDGTVIFHAGTTRDTDGILRTSGGRVLAASATGADLAAARSWAYQLLGQVRFDGMRYRQDIAATAAAVPGNSVQ
ncbi:MAG TPA: phosphoribosylamine--glycine ligase [Streptosporangiaceae bacterium]|nr:phosphoribosylamine--glycine ligase [Streptosporangiaceae bacterium]